MRATARCASCRQILDVTDIPVGSRVACPNCRAVFVLPAEAPSAPRKPGQTSEHIMASPGADVSSAGHFTEAPGEPRSALQPAEDAPYEVAKFGPTCPGCGEEVAESAAKCGHCGHAFEILEPPPLPPIKRVWDGSPPVGTRLKLFVAYEIGLVVFGLTAGLLSGATLTQLGIYGVLISFMAAFVMGTFDRVDLTRTFQGRVTLAKTWRVCFIALRPELIVLREYENIGTTVSHDHDFFDWAVLVWLFSLGCLPGIVWFLLVFSKPAYRAALTKNHGFPALILYSGRDLQHMEDLAETVGEVCRYEVRRSY